MIMLFRNMKMSNSGFSLIETLVAMTVLLLVVVGPMRIIATSARGSNFSSNQVTALFLAQEGIELSRKARDEEVLSRYNVNNGVDPSYWGAFTDTGNTGKYKACFGSAGCDFYYSNIFFGNSNGEVNVVDCSIGGSCKMTYDADPSPEVRSHFVPRAAGRIQAIPTSFTRRVRFMETVPDQEVKVVSTVSWFDSTQRQEHQVVLESRLFNIYGN